MKVKALWYGGSGYSRGDFEDIEEFESLEAAAQIFFNRYLNRDYPQTPCVDLETTEMWIFFGDPNPGDFYPDRIIRFGPRGGIIQERV